METVDTNSNTGGSTIRDQLAKVILGATAAFLAGKVVEDLYDKFVVARRNKVDITND